MDRSQEDKARKEGREHADESRLDLLPFSLEQLREDLAGDTPIGNGATDDFVAPTPADIRRAREEYIGTLDELPKTSGDPAAIGRTMFDTPQAEDDASPSCCHRRRSKA